MAEYDKGRYYWIKLTDRLMMSDTVDFLMSQPDGANYVILYQMLCLKTVNNKGVMARELGDVLIPYDVEKIQRDCKWFSVDTIRIALGLYKRLGLVYEEDNGILVIVDHDRLVGSEGESAERVRRHREKKAQMALQCNTECNLQSNIEKEREKEREKEKDSHSFILSRAEEMRLSDEQERLLNDPGYRRAYLGGIGKGVVMLSDEQMSDILQRFGVDEFDKYVGIIADQELKGRHYTKKTHYQAIISMALKDRRVYEISGKK